MRTSGENGQIAVGFMLLTIVIFMFFALAMDAGLWYLDHRMAQNQVDAAAHGSAFELPDENAAREMARTILIANGVTNPEADACEWGWFEVRHDAIGDPRTVVCQRRSSSVLFSALSGVTDIKVSALASAAVFETPLYYSLMAMNDKDGCPSLNVSGKAKVTINGGGKTYVRDDCDKSQGALSADGQGSLTSAGNDVVGNQVLGGPQASISPTNKTDATWIEDPFGFLLQPKWTSSTLHYPGGNTNGTVTLQPGVYDSKVNITSPSANVTLAPGVYYFRDGISMSNGTLRSSGEVLLYSTCSSTPCNNIAKAGDFSFTGGNLTLTGHSAYQNILFWIDRTSQYQPPATLTVTGGGVVNLSGIAYALSSDVTIVGGGTADLTLNMSMIADQIAIKGDGKITIQYDLLTAPKFVALAIVE